MSAIVQPALNPNMTALLQMLKAKYAVTLAGKVWIIDSAITVWPELGRWQMSRSKGGRSGTFRGRAESIYEQIEKGITASYLTRSALSGKSNHRPGKDGGVRNLFLRSE